MRCLKNRQDNKASIQSTIRLGTVVFSDEPRLNLEALSEVPRYRLGDSNQAFISRFGDYYVAAMRLGADNAMLISNSGSENSKSETLHASVTGKILGFSKTKSVDSYEQEGKALSDVTVNAFDTLDSIHVEAPAFVDNLYINDQRRQAAELASKGRLLESRARSRMQQLELRNRKILTSEDCMMLCDSGLVVEFVCSPFSRLRDYSRISNSVA